MLRQNLNYVNSKTKGVSPPPPLEKGERKKDALFGHRVMPLQLEFLELKTIIRIGMNR